MASHPTPTETQDWRTDWTVVPECVFCHENARFEIKITNGPTVTVCVPCFHQHILTLDCTEVTIIGGLHSGVRMVVGTVQA